MTANKNQLQKAPADLMALAIEKGASLDYLEKLMDLQERWEKKEASKSFKNAMANFQAGKPEIKKTGVVDYTYNGARTFYMHAVLSEIQKQIDPVLSKQGLSYRWEQDESDGEIKITCILSHADGHEEKTHITAPRDSSGGKNTVQSIGSTITYLQRYTLINITGLSASENIDAKDKAFNKKDDDPLNLDREVLNPKHKMWSVLKAGILNETKTIDEIRKKYKVSKNSEKLLKAKK